MACSDCTRPSDLPAASRLLARSIKGELIRANAPIFRSELSCALLRVLAAAPMSIDPARMSTSRAASTLLAVCVYFSPAVSATSPFRLPSVDSTCVTDHASSLCLMLL